MIVKILGIFDVFVALVFWLFGIFHIIPESFILLLGFFLLAKGVVFAVNLNVVSILDIISGLIIIAATAIALPKMIVIIVSLFLIQKGVISLLS